MMGIKTHTRTIDDEHKYNEFHIYGRKKKKKETRRKSLKRFSSRDK